jgi:hypothetical protein
MMPFNISAIGWGEVQCLGGFGHDAVAVAQIRVDIVRSALGAAGQQRPGVGEHHGVVVHVDDPGLRRDLLRHLVRVVRGRQAGA